MVLPHDLTAGTSSGEAFGAQGAAAHLAGVVAQRGVDELEGSRQLVDHHRARADPGEIDLLAAPLGAERDHRAQIIAGHEDRLSGKVQEANRALKQQTANIEKLNQASRNSDKLNDLSTKATGAGLGMIAAGTAAGLPVVASTRQAMTLESAMADVAKVTNMTRPQIERKINMMTSDDALKYMPSLFLRKMNPAGGLPNTGVVVETRTWGVNSSARRRARR